VHWGEESGRPISEYEKAQESYKAFNERDMKVVRAHYLYRNLNLENLAAKGNNKITFQGSARSNVEQKE